MLMFWEDGFRLKESIYNFAKDRNPKWPMSVMTIGDIPITAHHMDVVESYPNTFDAIHGNYK